MQPTWRRATFTQPLKMLFSPSVMACTSTMPNTVQRWIVSTACAQVSPGAPIACRAGDVASRMLSAMHSGIGSCSTSSSWIWMAPTMLCSMRTRARTLRNSRPGSAGRRGWQSQSIPHPGTSVQCRITTSAPHTEVSCAASAPTICTGRPVISSPSSVKRLAAAIVTIRASGRSVCQSISRSTGRVRSAARSCRVWRCPSWMAIGST